MNGKKAKRLRKIITIVDAHETALFAAGRSAKGEAALAQLMRELRAIKANPAKGENDVQD